MTKAERAAIDSTMESIDIDLKHILAARRKAQAELDTINDKVRAAFTRLQNLEARLNG